MTRATHERFQQAKRKRNLIDFSDLEQMTLAVLDQAPVREKLQGEWDHIFVDECQDVSCPSRTPFSSGCTGQTTACSWWGT